MQKEQYHQPTVFIKASGSAAHPHLALPVDTRLQPKKGHRLAPDMIAAQGGCATFEFDEAVPASVR